MATKVNTKTMLKYEDIEEDIVIEKDGHAYSEDGSLLMKKPTGIYSDAETSVDGIFKDSSTITRIKGNDAILELVNSKTITIRNYFKNNGKSSFSNITFVDEKGTVSDSTNIIAEGLLTNKNLYNEYNLATNHAEDGIITKTTIQGTVFNDIVDLSGFDANQLVDSKGNALKSLTIKTDKGNDTITGSIINDNITGGAGENTLNFTDYSGKIAADSAYGDDIYNLTKDESLNLVYAGSSRESNLSYAKVGNDIVITDTVTNSVEYTRTKITGDTVATKYTKVEVVGNSTAKSGGEHDGKYAKVTKTYTRNNANDGWSLESDDETTYEDNEVVESTKYVKNVNGSSTETRNNETDFDYNDEGKYNQTTTTYIIKKDAENSYSWQEVSPTSDKVDAAVTASDTVYSKENGVTNVVTTEDAGSFAGTLTDEDFVGDDVQVGSLTLKNLGKDNNLGNVTINGVELFDTSSYDRVFNIDGTKGGTIQGTKGNDIVYLDSKDATLSAVEGQDVVITGTGSVTFKMSDSMQDLIDTDLYQVGRKSETILTVNDLEGNSSLLVDFTVDPKSVSVVDSTKAKYNVTMADEAELTTTGNNLVFSESTTGTTIKTGTGNDVVILNDSPTTTEDVTNADLVDSAFTVNEDKATISRAITSSDLIEVKAGDTVCDYADGKLSRAVVEADLKDSSATKFVNKAQVSVELTNADVKTDLQASFVIEENVAYVTVEGSKREVTTDDLIEGSEYTAIAGDRGIRATKDADVKKIDNFEYADGKYSRGVVASDLTSATTEAGLSLDGTTKLKKDIKKEDLVLADNQAYDEISHKISSSFLNTISYTGGKDAYLGSKTSDKYDIITIDNKTVVSINDLGGSDILKFSNQNFKDITIFFDYNKDSKLEDVTDLAFLSDSAIKANKFTTGGVLLQNYFDGKEAGGAGVGQIEEIFVAGGVDAVDMTSRIDAIKANVVAWFVNNGNYDSAMEVLESGNNADIQSLMQCYAAGSTL